MKNACLVCGEDLIFFKDTKEMECVFCHNKYMSNASCEKGHYVCDECHGKQAISHIKSVAFSSKSKNPMEIAVEMMKSPYVYMHGNENHTLVGSALLAAYNNAGGDLELGKSIEEMHQRGRQIPGGVCGFWGACGAAISAGIFVSLVTGATPIADKEWGQANIMTSKALEKIGKIGGPRCCKRNAFISIREAVDYCKKEFNVNMELSDIECDFYSLNEQCIGIRCPYNSNYSEIHSEQ